MKISALNSIRLNDNIAQKSVKQNMQITNYNQSKAVKYPYSASYISFGKTNGINGGSEMNPVLETILSEYTNLPEVQAVAIGGSSTGKYADSKSDIDVYVFTNGDIPVQKREEIAKKYSTKREIGQDYFGPDDEYFADELGREVDVIYFDKKWFEDGVHNVWENHNASNGYTTCFLYTLKNARTISDKDGWLKGLKDKINTPYPDKLKENIIRRNTMLMYDKPFSSYYEQIEKAVQRGDLNSVNHRITEFMASYFDVIFAKNELLHPGEKRLVKYAQDNCRVLPEKFEENIKELYTKQAEEKLPVLDDMIEQLKKCLD